MTLPPSSPPTPAPGSLSPPSFGAATPPTARVLPAVPMPPSIATAWTNEFQEDRNALSDISQQAMTTLPVELVNRDIYWDFAQDLFTIRSDHRLLEALEAHHREYLTSLAPRRAALTTAQGILHQLTSAPPGSGPPPSHLNHLTLQLTEFGIAKFNEINTDFIQSLRRVIRRARRIRFAWESANAILALALFNLLFGSVEESICEWIHTASGSAVPVALCRDIHFGVTLALFAAERWFLGPWIDAFIEKRTKGLTVDALGNYYGARTHLEYTMATAEAGLAQVRAPLKNLGITI